MSIDSWPVTVVWSMGMCSMEVVMPLPLLPMLLVYCFTYKERAREREHFILELIRYGSIYYYPVGVDGLASLA